MRLESARGLKAQLLKEVVEPLAVANRLGGRSAVPFAVGARPFDTLPRIPPLRRARSHQSQGDTGLPFVFSVPASCKAR